MTFRIADRVLETTNSTGTGTITLLGAVAGYRAFSSVVTADGDWFPYTIDHGIEWEVGLGVRLSATTFSRSTVNVLASSNAGALVNFTAGASVWIDIPASMSQGARIDPSRNIIVNGGFEVSQARVGNSFTGTGLGPDCWATTTSMASATITSQQLTSSLGAGSTKSYVLTSTTGAAVGAAQRASAYSPVEGYRWSRLGYGGASAQSAVLSFNVLATISGTMVVAIQNEAATRSYVKTIPISAGSTWEFKQILIPGDTTGTWDVGTGIGARVLFNFAGGATFQGTDATWQAGDFTGVSGQTNFFATNGNLVSLTAVSLFRGIEGPTANDAITMHRPFSEELAICQRYYEKSFNEVTMPAQNAGINTGELIEASAVAAAAGVILGSLSFRVAKRATPAMTGFNPQAANADVRNESLGSNCTATAFIANDRNFFVSALTPASTIVGHQMGIHWTADSRLS